MVDRDAQEEALLTKHTAALVVGFWLLYFLISSIRAPLLEEADPADLAQRRVLSFAIGMLLCYVMTVPIRRHVADRFSSTVIFGVMLAGFASVVHAVIHMTIYLVFWPLEGLGPRTIPFTFEGVVVWSTVWLNTYLAFIALYLILLNNSDVRSRSRQLAALQSLTHDAQVRSLHYQINPHLLFNALNSVSAMIIDAQYSDAERMILQLSKFYRASLAMDPAADIPLAEEICLQQVYLEIERFRFEDDLMINIDIPEHLDSALVPAMILQPLVENAVKHGVAKHDGRSEITIEARSEQTTLLVAVCNQPAAPPGASRAGVGLENVRQRLAVRYGSNGRLTTRYEPANSFRAEISLPLSLRR